MRPSDGTRTVDREALVSALREYAAKGGIETPTGLIPLSTSFALMVAEEIDRLAYALEQARVFIAYLQRDLEGDDLHLDENGDPYHGDSCDQCRETRLLRIIADALGGTTE